MIFSYQSIPEWLSSELNQRIRVNPRYSLRGFATSLGLSPGELSEILRGKRKMTVKSLGKVCRRMNLNASEAQHILGLLQLDFLDENAGTLGPKSAAVHGAALGGDSLNGAVVAGKIASSASDHSRKLLLEDVFQLISEWFNFAILNLMEVDGFQWNSTWISRRLGITRTQAMQAMERLLRLQLITIRRGRAVPSHNHVFTAEDIPSRAIRNYHREILAKALEALETQSVEERDITGSGFALDPKYLPAIKKDIAEFQDKLIRRYNGRGKKNEVYHLEMALFRLTTGRGGGTSSEG